MSLTNGQPGTGKTAAPAGDHTGRDRMVRNVITSWAGYSVHVVTGFILPRIIDNSLGQVSLGIWDFGWSIASYFTIVSLGIGSSVNRYVAKYRMEGDTDAMNRAVSSVMSVQIVSALVALVATVVIAWNLPAWFGDRLGANIVEAQWVVLFLGSAISLQVGSDGFNGIMTGCHRWDLHNAINAGFQASSALAMIIVLWSGGGLRELAGVYLVTLAVTEVIRAFIVFRICPELRLNRRLVELRKTWEMFVFGSKTLIGGISELLVYQTSNLLIVAYLGPAALALFARPLALVRVVFTFVQKFAFVLTPTVSSLLAKGRQEEVKELFLTSVRYGAHMALPPILALAVLGGSVLDVWMGPNYVRPELIAVLSLGYLASVAHSPVINILIGLNHHGRAALALLAAASITAVLAWLFLEFTEMGLTGVALAIVLPGILVRAFVIPFYACRHLELSLMVFYRNVWIRPLLSVLPFAATLIVIRLMFPGQPVSQILWTLGMGGAVLCVTYWYWVFPDEIRRKIRTRLLRWIGRSAHAPDSGAKK